MTDSVRTRERTLILMAWNHLPHHLALLPPDILKTIDDIICACPIDTGLPVVVANIKASLRDDGDDPCSLAGVYARLDVCREAPQMDGWTAGACAVGRSDVAAVLGVLDQIRKLEEP